MFRLTAGHALGLLFIIYAAISLTWTTVVYDGLNELIQFSFLALAYCYGAELKSLRGVYIGAALALTVSAVISIGQINGYSPVDQYISPGGLFGNKNFMGEAAAMVLVAVISERLWWLIPGPLLALVLAQAKGAWLAAIIALAVAAWKHSRRTSIAIFIGVICIAIYGLGQPHYVGTFLQRIDVWKDAFDGMSFWGHGAGSFYTEFPHHATRIPPLLITFQNAHNDQLELIFNSGPGYVFILGVFVYSLWSAGATERAVLTAFFLSGLVGFPLFMPFTAFLAALCLGRAVYGGGSLRRALDRSLLYPEGLGALWRAHNKAQ